MISPKPLVMGRVWGLQWNWPFRMDRPRLRYYLLPLPWSPSPQRTDKRQKEAKNIKHNGNIAFDETVNNVQQMWHQSLARKLSGIIKEILGISSKRKNGKKWRGEFAMLREQGVTWMQRQVSTTDSSVTGSIPPYSLVWPVCLGLPGFSLSFQSNTYSLYPTQKLTAPETVIIVSFHP